MRRQNQTRVEAVIGEGDKKMSATTISNTPEGLLRRMVDIETKMSGDQLNAIDRVSRRIGLGARTVRRILHNERKIIDYRVFSKIRAAYLELCERQLRKLEHEIAVTTAEHEDTDVFEDIALEAAALRVSLARKKAQLPE